MKLMFLFIIITSLSACAVYPKTKHDLDNARCQLHTKKFSLDATSIKTKCSSGSAHGGALCIAVMGLVGVTTAVVSSSVVILGNTVHWIEKQGKCSDSFLNRKILKRNDHLLEGHGELISIPSPKIESVIKPS
jgi:hypothetical protein